MSTEESNKYDAVITHDSTGKWVEVTPLSWSVNQKEVARLSPIKFKVNQIGSSTLNFVSAGDEIESLSGQDVEDVVLKILMMYTSEKGYASVKTDECRFLSDAVGRIKGSSFGYLTAGYHYHFSDENWRVRWETSSEGAPKRIHSMYSTFPVVSTIINTLGSIKIGPSDVHILDDVALTLLGVDDGIANAISDLTACDGLSIEEI